MQATQAGDEIAQLEDDLEARQATQAGDKGAQVEDKSQPEDDLEPARKVSLEWFCL